MAKTKDFSELVKETGSVSAALAAQGYSQDASGTWRESSGGTTKSTASKSSSSSGTAVSNPTSDVGSLYGVTNIGKTATGADLSRRSDLAGSVAQSGGQTVFYDDNGYAYKALKGAVDYTPTLDRNVSGGSYGKNGAWTDNEMLTAEDLAKIAEIRNSTMTGDEKNAAANAIRAAYGYSIDKGGLVTDMNALGQVNKNRERWGLPTTTTEGVSQSAVDALLSQINVPQTAQSAGSTAYSGKWDSVWDNLANQLLDMDYTDWTNSDQYKALAERYSRNGQMSMQDVLGQVSSRTGGLASSYATSAAQQQYNDYMTKLEEAARAMYADERADIAENANLAYQGAQRDYNRYTDQRDYDYQLSRDAVSDARYADELEYSRGRDSLSDSRYDTEWNYQVQQDEQKAAQEQAATLAAYGDFSGYKALGYTDSQIALMQAAYQQQLAAQAAKTAKSSGSPGSSSSSSDTVNYQGLYDAGARSEGDAYAMLVNSGYKSSDASKIAKYFASWAEENYSRPVANGKAMNGDNFRAFGQSISAQLRSGKEEAALSNVESQWGSLSESQREQVQTLLERYGLMYEE